jgi:hypothetical protein
VDFFRVEAGMTSEEKRAWIMAGAAALAMAMAELNHFWIANVIYLAFVLSSILGSATKIVAYRLGFHPW